MSLIYIFIFFQYFILVVIFLKYFQDGIDRQINEKLNK